MPVLLTSCLVCITIYNTNKTEITSFYRKELHMVIELDFASDTPIYVQLRNQIFKGIGKGELKAGEKLTVNKTYQILKAEGFIKTDRRLGAFVAENINMDIEFREKLESELELLSAEASITGMDKAEFLKMCENIYSKMNPCTM